MRKIINIMLVIFFFFLFFACEKKNSPISVEKDDNLYEVEDIVSFYYPKDYTLDTTSRQNKSVVHFVKDKETMFYTTLKDDTDNNVEDMPALYAGELEENKANNVKYRLVETTSGLSCYEFTGVYTKTGIKFKHLIYFTADASYVLGYYSTANFYDKNIGYISKYLDTLVVNHK